MSMAENSIVRQRVIAQRAARGSGASKWRKSKNRERRNNLLKMAEGESVVMKIENINVMKIMAKKQHEKRK
jgi:hypothetical protein